MKYFVATILSKGKKQYHPIYAHDRREANDFAKLKFSGIIIKVVEEKEPFEAQFKRFKTNLLQNIKKRKIAPDALISAVEQLATMTNAGLSIHDSLLDIANSTNDANLEYVFSKLADEINSGHSLSASMEKFRYELGGLTIAMVQLGEKTGKIDEALDSLANMLGEIRANIIKFKKAMAYPRNVMISMAIAFTVLISYVVPKFKTIFDKMNSELPLPTQILLKLEYIFNNYGPYIIILLVLGFFIFKYLIQNNTNIRYSWHALLLKLYLINKIIKYSTLSRFTLIFSELIKAGIPISDALETSANMVENLPMKHKLLSVKNTVEKGGSLKKGLQDTKLFEKMIISMVDAAENSGSLQSMSAKIAKYFKMKFDGIIDGLNEAIEPIMLMIIASMVILLALGIFMPMWDLGNAVKGR